MKRVQIFVRFEVFSAVWELFLILGPGGGRNFEQPNVEEPIFWN